MKVFQSEIYSLNCPARPVISKAGDFRLQILDLRFFLSEEVTGCFVVRTSKRLHGQRVKSQSSYRST